MRSSTRTFGFRRSATMPIKSNEEDFVSTSLCPIFHQKIYHEGESRAINNQRCPYCPNLHQRLKPSTSFPPSQFSILLSLLLLYICEAQRFDPTQLNGGSILAMSGRNCVAIAVDARFGLGMQTIAAVGSQVGSNTTAPSGGSVGMASMSRILILPSSDTIVAWAGLFGDGIGFAEELSVCVARTVRRGRGFRGGSSGGIDAYFRGTNNFAGNRGILSHAPGKKILNPRAIAMLMSNLLYRRRSAPYYIEPVVVGLEPINVSQKHSDDNEVLKNFQQNQENLDFRQRNKQSLLYHRPYLCTQDCLGATSTSSSFVCAGVASRSLHGTAEALWRPNLEGADLVEICGRAFVSALERDCLSGYGAIVYLMRGTCSYNDSGDIEGGGDVEVIEYILAVRND